jgi:hypothetical protein
LFDVHDVDIGVNAGDIDVRVGGDVGVGVGGIDIDFGSDVRSFIFEK